ncbi:N-terminal double-transmembrane domain-containing protein [Tenacibaculum sp. MAR_2009_124]|uniref:BatA domain-containing protein n=1 Tax=Tenacibaculum sp. MAR_2009_124 TaxID=1250059 RepID=UPI000897E210|nr:BatA domain-containing protein [Tenacibaculum sp. MAR_2009_124]SEB36635.1 N-terminal double-transmembrane domain-containing protein [Tenacibaculum sp. MAR_2009_124]
MQFKQPEILYFLALLLIPIIVHLFQLQRFVKVPFTNVAFLQKLSLQTRKSSRIKKWLILTTRLLLLTFLILAFAQPYFSNREASEKLHYSIYLDNSLSTKTKGKRGDLLQIAVQDLVENLSENSIYSLQTNTNFYPKKTSDELKDILFGVKNSASQKSIKDVLLKMATQQNNDIPSFKRVLISDFQNIPEEDFNNIDYTTALVQLTPQLKENISLDSVYIENTKANTMEVKIIVKNQGTEKKNIPIAIYNDESLVNKQTFDIEENSNKTITFSLQKTPILLGKLVLNYSDTYSFDNTFYFTLTTNEKINVLSIGAVSSYLPKIYTPDEFNFSQTSLQKTNYNAIAKQQLVVLNELEEIPVSMQETLKEYAQKGGYLVLIPNANSNTSSYKSLFKKLGIKTSLFEKDTDSLKITNINFKHPIFANVFEKNVRNFQYPYTSVSYNTTLSNTSNILSFENKKGFISQIKSQTASVFWVSSPINKKYSNFSNSPLIVPVFYNIGKQSLKITELYYTVEKENTIDISDSFGKDAVLTIANSNHSFIPLQQVFQNKIRITTNEQPIQSGFNYILKQKDTLKRIAFNYHQQESLLAFPSTQNIVNQKQNLSISSSVKSTLNSIKKKNEVQWLWKWFLALSIVSLLFEILILKFFKS